MNTSRMRVALMASLLLAAASAARGAEPCPATGAYGELRKAMSDLHDALAKRFGDRWSSKSLPAQLAEQVDLLEAADRDLKKQATSLQERWEDCATQSRRVDFDTREIDSKRKQIDLEEEQIKPRMADLLKRKTALEREKDAHNLSMPPLDNEAAMARWNAEAVDGNRRVAVLNGDIARLKEESAALQKRRAALFSDVIDVASRSNILARRRSVLLQDLSPMLLKTRRAVVQARALAQIPASGVAIAQAPAGLSYQRFDEAGKEVLKDMAQEASLQVLKRAVIASEGPGIVVAVKDVVADTAAAGVDARTREVERNLLLIGDYGRVLKRMKESGTLKPDDPAYQAIREVLQEQQASLPGSNAEIVLQGLGKAESTVAGATKAISTIVGSYAQEKVSHAGAAVVKHLSNAERQTLGKGMVSFFSGSISGTAEVAAGQGTDQAAKASEQLLEAGTEKILRQMDPPERPATGAGHE